MISPWATCRRRTLRLLHPLPERVVQMSDLLALTERVRNTIQLGESHFREFKSALEERIQSKRTRPVKPIGDDIAEALAWALA